MPAVPRPAGGHHPRGARRAAGLQGRRAHPGPRGQRLAGAALEEAEEGAREQVHGVTVVRKGAGGVRGAWAPPECALVDHCDGPPACEAEKILLLYLRKKGDL